MTDYAEDLLRYSAKLQELSSRYATERMRFGKLDSELKLILATKIKSYMEKNKNIGIELAMLQLVSDTTLPIQEMYKEMLLAFNNYKALGVLIESQQSAIMALQSVMRYNRSGEFAPEKE